MGCGVPTQSLWGRHKPLGIRANNLVGTFALGVELVQGKVVPQCPHGLKSRVKVPVHLLVVGQSWLVPHPLLPLQDLVKLQLQALMFLVQDP